MTRNFGEILDSATIRALQRQAEAASSIVNNLNFEEHLAVVKAAQQMASVYEALAPFEHASRLASTFDCTKLKLAESAIVALQRQAEVSSSMVKSLRIEEHRPVIEAAQQMASVYEALAPFEHANRLAASALDSGFTLAESVVMAVQRQSVVASSILKNIGAQADYAAAALVRLHALDRAITLVQMTNTQALSGWTELGKQQASIAEGLARLSGVGSETAEVKRVPVRPLPQSGLGSSRGAKLVRGEAMRELTLGKICLAKEMWVEAEYHGSQAAGWLDVDPEPHVVRAIALNRLGRFKESVAAFECAEARGTDFWRCPLGLIVYEFSLMGRRWDRTNDVQGDDSAN